MTELIIGNNEIASAIRKLFSTTNDIRCAVAFWGAGAINIFGGNKNQKVEIICNLMSGGTNPAEIVLIQNQFGIKTVRMKNDLHSKVYWTNKGVIIGSANASSNGLGLQGNETSGWVESALLCTDSKIIEDTRAWLDTLWNESTPIFEQDIKNAEKQWKTNCRDRINTGNEKSFLDALRSGAYDHRNIHIVLDVNTLTNKQERIGNKNAKKLIKTRPELLNKTIDYWYDYQSIPRNANIFNFIIDQKNIEYFELFLTLDLSSDIDNYQFCYKIKPSAFLMSYKHSIKLQKAVKLLFKSEQTNLIKKKEALTISLEDLTTMLLSNKDIISKLT